MVQASDDVRDGAVESVGIGEGAVHGCTPRTAAIFPARRPPSVSKIARAGLLRRAALISTGRATRPVPQHQP
jgi:hypothetical protein